MIQIAVHFFMNKKGFKTCVRVVKCFMSLCEVAKADHGNLCLHRHTWHLGTATAPLVGGPARSCLISNINQQESHLEQFFLAKVFFSTKRRLSCYSQCPSGPPHLLRLSATREAGGTYVESRPLQLSSQI
jgi:hypothetical protein